MQRLFKNGDCGSSVDVRTGRILSDSIGLGGPELSRFDDRVLQQQSQLLGDFGAHNLLLSLSKKRKMDDCVVSAVADSSVSSSSSSASVSSILHNNNGEPLLQLK